MSHEYMMDRQTGRVLTWLLVAVLIAIATLLIVIGLLYKEQANEVERATQADKVSTQERAALRQAVDELRHKYEELKSDFDLSKKHYDNRAIIQKAVAMKMIEKGMFSPEVTRMLLQVMEGADYPE